MVPDVALFPLEVALDLAVTCRCFVFGHGDPCARIDSAGVWRATRTTAGPATIQLRIEAGRLEARAWGPGASRVLAAAPGHVGLEDLAESFRPPRGPVRDLHRRRPGLRITATGAVFEALAPTVLAQKVTGGEAMRAWRGVVRRFSGKAPGPAELLLPPSPDDLAGVPYFELHRFGVERRRADALRRAASRARALEVVTQMPRDAAYARITSIPGLGWWTAAEVMSIAAGDADAVQVGDFHIPNEVAWNLAGQPRGDDKTMLELLEPYRGHRQRVIRLIETAGQRPPAFGPKQRVRSISVM